jgi:hypothetical protein
VALSNLISIREESNSSRFFNFNNFIIMARLDKFKQVGVGLGLDPVLKKAEKGETNLARLAHANEIIAWIKKAGTELHASNNAAKTAGLKTGDLYSNSVTRALHVVHD